MTGTILYADYKSTTLKALPDLLRVGENICQVLGNDLLV